MPISNQEAFNMLSIYFECFQNATIAARTFYLRYPNRPRYHRRVFVRLAQRLLTTGSIHTPAMNRRNRQNNEQNVINVLASVEINPQISTREISRDLDIPQTTVHRIIQTQRLHPYHINLHQGLTPPDFDRRMDFCHWLLNMVAENPQFLLNVLWTDEATFGSDGQLNIHNTHFWARNNPRWLGEVQHQGRYSVNVWCGIIGGRVVGPFILDGALNGRTYLDFLENVLPILMEDIPLDVRQNLFFQHDGCPAHYALAVRQYLDATFPDRWIGRGSLFPWPPRSPDLTCLDFYLWGRIKDIVFAARPTSREDMIARIRNAILNIPRAEIETAVLSTHRRLQMCIQNNGGHFEHLGRH